MIYDTFCDIAVFAKFVSCLPTLPYVAYRPPRLRTMNVVGAAALRHTRSRESHFSLDAIRGATADSSKSQRSESYSIFSVAAGALCSRRLLWQPADNKALAPFIVLCVIIVLISEKNWHDPSRFVLFRKAYIANQNFCFVWHVFMHSVRRIDLQSTTVAFCCTTAAFSSC